MTRRKWQTGVLAGAAGLALVTGCGSSHKSSPPTTTSSPGVQYERITAPLVADVARSPSTSSGMGPYQAVQADAKTARDQLLGYVWPAKTSTSVSHMARALLVLSTAKSPGAVKELLTVVRTDDQVLRTDLGLPARSSTAFELQAY